MIFTKKTIHYLDDNRPEIDIIQIFYKIFGITFFKKTRLKIEKAFRGEKQFV
jgi:hypothetical protein